MAYRINVVFGDSRIEVEGENDASTRSLFDDVCEKVVNAKPDWAGIEQKRIAGNVSPIGAA